MPTKTKSTPLDNEQWARAKLYAIDPYQLEESERAWFHSKANDICRWDSGDLAMALMIIRRAAAATRRTKPKRRSK